MTNGPDNSPPTDAAAKLAAAQQKAAELKALQGEVDREMAAAESEAASESVRQQEDRLRERERAQAARLKKQAEVRAAKKKAKAAAATAAATAPPVVAEVARTAPPAAPTPVAPTPDAATQSVAVEDDSFVAEVDEEDEDGEFINEPIDETHAETGQRRKRIALYCFSCNRPEGHFLTYYRKMWYSYIIGTTFGLAIIVGPYRCQCCGANRLMLSNLLNLRYYVALFSTKSNKRRSSRR